MTYINFHPLRLFFKIESIKLSNPFFELFQVVEIRDLFMFHAKYQHLMEQLYFLVITCGLRLYPLGHEILGDDFLQLISMFFLIYHPAH